MIDAKLVATFTESFEVDVSISDCAVDSSLCLSMSIMACGDRERVFIPVAEKISKHIFGMQYRSEVDEVIASLDALVDEAKALRESMLEPEFEPPRPMHMYDETLPEDLPEDEEL